MTTTNTKTATRPPDVAPHATRTQPKRRLGREFGLLAVNVYERSVADVVAFEKDAAKVVPYEWAKSALTMTAELVEDVGAAYVKTARTALR